MRRYGIWRTLGIDSTTDTTAIRRAYATALRAMDPDADPDGFARLRDARDAALASARAGEVADDPLDTTASTGDDDDDPRDIPDLTTLQAPRLDGSGIDGDVSIAPAVPADPRFWTVPAAPDDGTGSAIDAALPADTLAPPVIDLSGGDIVVRRAADSIRYDEAYARLYDLLLPEGPDTAVWLTDDEEAEALTLLDLLLGDPRLDTIDFGSDAEQWFANVLASAIPRSDALLDRVSRRFGWDRRAGTIDQGDAAERVATRSASLDYAAAAAQSGHPDHALWRDLVAAKGDWRSLFIRRKRMQAYLARTTKTFPDVEAFWNPVRVAKWTRPISGPGRFIWGFGAFVLIKLLIVIAQPTDTSPNLSPPTLSTPSEPIAGGVPLNDRDLDIDLVLSGLDEAFTAAVAKAQNRPLYDALSAQWDTAKAEGKTIPDFVRETQDWLGTRAGAAIRQAPRPLIVRWREMELATVTNLQNRGAITCIDYLDGDTDPQTFLSDAARRDRRRLLTEIVLADQTIEAPNEPRRRTFTIPGSVIDKVADRTALNDEELSAALRRDGSAENRCAVRRALLEVALDTPGAEGLKLLRTM